LAGIHIGDQGYQKSVRGGDEAWAGLEFDLEQKRLWDLLF